MKYFFALLLLSLAAFHLSAQVYIGGAATRWDDSFVEWDIYTYDEDVTGELQQRWKLQNDWSKWDYRVADEVGRIESRWMDDYDDWTLYGSNRTVHARTRWARDYSEWRITDNGQAVYLKALYPYQRQEWVVKTDSLGYMKLWTSWEGDPRDWTIEDELSDEISLPMRMMITFLVLFNSTPRL